MSRHSVRTWVFLLFALAFAGHISGQSSPVVSPIPPSAAHVFQTDDYRIDIDTVAEDIGMLADADLTGYTCYRLFVTTGSPDDQLSAVFGNIDAPAALLTTGDFFQSYPIGDVTASGIVPTVWPSFPSNQYDSFVTIGLDQPADAANGEGDVLTVQSSAQPWQPVFEPGNGLPGSGFELNDMTGGTWFTQASYSNGIAGPDQRILIAQLTTDGTLSGNLNVQIFLEGDNQFGTVYLNLDLPVFGCTDASACNFDPGASEDDGSCAELDECGVCGGEGIAAGDCDCDGNQLDALGICGGDCAADLDGDGLCDDDDDCVGSYDDCGICNGPGAIHDCGCDDIPTGDCDCDGNQLDALGVCGGDCTADADGDGLCDDVDDCVGSYDDCGVCNGPGAIYDCGCEDIPAGDCDCNGNQLDALGVCGGDCSADLDGDGLCDDVDVCVGSYDDCGICNGPGAIYDCGCEDIPAGDCDCDGNQLDALGVCGGDCTADADGDGLCDDADDCVGSYDDCGICNGPGAIYDCGCDDIPAGDCDCDGNQLDALGVCGGDCTADADGDGLCDDVDDCVGSYDDCGICNGPGAIDDCGCEGIPTGDCDCDGNQLDALGVCGGDCSGDIDSDGVCDSDEIPGCTNADACNYQPTATDDDGSCLMLDACGVCGGPGAIYDCGCEDIPAGDCDCDGNQLDALGVCGGDCSADADGDGLCDDVDDCVGSYDDCGICNGPGAIYDCGCEGIPPGDCDCDGNQLDALGVCGGDCAADADGDLLCDDIDDCVGSYDDCGICNGPGAIYDCGCEDVPAGDCDCDGNQLDALGVCGGDCTADVDGDGLCDNVDDCVGTYDECGICNGPGAIYDCGCEGIPAGDCDCDGNQLDALGVCGGDCTADADGDGLCDDVDDCVGSYDDCGICNGPGAIYDCGCEGIPVGDCDCDGNQLDALGVCGGDCLADLDGDGLCDDVDDCVGSYDDCGICNGPGTIYDCGCDDIPAGDCDCDGNQLDALGVCGGDCSADLDGDGLCDDVDDCVGSYDDCGICNGPSEIYDCGCEGIPAGDCDCDGNQLDALGVCGGDCTADVDGDGVCDTDEVPGCTDSTADNYNPSATDEDGTCTYTGCMDPEADNYNPNATLDSGSCAYTCVGITGCTYTTASNYAPDADCEDGSCEFALSVDSACIFDLDGSGFVGAYDLLIFLQYFEFNCN